MSSEASSNPSRSGAETVLKVGMVIHPVRDMETAISFYTDGLGLEPRFRDGDRFCAFDVGGVTVALAAGAEAVADATAVSYKVADLDATIRHLVASGALLVREPEKGPHEVRAVLRDPSGNPFILYAGR